MEKKELRDYITKGKKRIDLINIELKSISDYREEYRSELDSIKYGRGSFDKEEYFSRYNAIKDKYSDIDSKDIIENALYLESKNIKKMITHAAALLVDELSRQPEKAINKPIHYKVFQEAFNNAKEKAWSDIEGLSDYFSSYVLKGCYGSTFNVYIRYLANYEVNLGYFIDRESYLIDIAGAIDFFEKFQYVEIDKIKDIVNEALETKALYEKKAMDLEKERAAAMDKYKDISISA